MRLFLKAGVKYVVWSPIVRRNTPTRRWNYNEFVTPVNLRVKERLNEMEIKGRVIVSCTLSCSSSDDFLEDGVHLKAEHHMRMIFRAQHQLKKAMKKVKEVPVDSKLFCTYLKSAVFFIFWWFLLNRTFYYNLVK